jgi:hypothetical protein
MIRKQRRGKAPKPVDDTPADKAQTNFTDPELHIMQTNNKGWEYCGNAQVSVDGACQIILACDVTDAANDAQQAEPVAQATQATLAQAAIERPKDESGRIRKIKGLLALPWPHLSNAPGAGKAVQAGGGERYRSALGDSRWGKAMATQEGTRAAVCPPSSRRTQGQRDPTRWRRLRPPSRTVLGGSGQA